MLELSCTTSIGRGSCPTILPHYILLGGERGERTMASQVSSRLGDCFVLQAQALIKNRQREVTTRQAQAEHELSCAFVRRRTHIVLALVNHGLDREDMAWSHDTIVLLVLVVDCDKVVRSETTEVLHAWHIVGAKYKFTRHAGKAGRLAIE